MNGRGEKISTAMMLVLQVGLLGSAVAAADTADRERNLAFFEMRIRPLLLARCGACHGPKKQEAGLRIDRRTTFFKGAKRSCRGNRGRAWC